MKKVVKGKRPEKGRAVGEKRLVKKRVVLNSDDELFASGSENDKKMTSSSSDDDVADNVKTICIDCGDELLDSDERYKTTLTHKRCGAHANAAKRMLVKRDPDLAKKWQKLKASGKKKEYRQVMASLGGKKRYGRFTDDMYAKLKDGLKMHTISRKKQVRKDSGYMFFDEEEFIQHWVHRKGWSKKLARKEYKKASGHVRPIGCSSFRFLLSTADYVLTSLGWRDDVLLSLRLGG